MVKTLYRHLCKIIRHLFINVNRLGELFLGKHTRRWVPGQDMTLALVPAQKVDPVLFGPVGPRVGGLVRLKAEATTVPPSASNKVALLPVVPRSWARM